MAGKNYVAVLNYYSHLPEIAKQVTVHIKSIFGRVGTSAIVTSDCGSQFDQHEFMQFTVNIIYVTTPPNQWVGGKCCENNKAPTKKGCGVRTLIHFSIVKLQSSTSEICVVICWHGTLKTRVPALLEIDVRHWGLTDIYRDMYCRRKKNPV